MRGSLRRDLSWSRGSPQKLMLGTEPCRLLAHFGEEWS